MSDNKTRPLSGCVYQMNNQIAVNLDHFKVTTQDETVRSIYDKEVTTKK